MLLQSRRKTSLVLRDSVACYLWMFDVSIAAQGFVLAASCAILRQANQLAAARPEHSSVAQLIVVDMYELVRLT